MFEFDRGRRTLLGGLAAACAIGVVPPLPARTPKHTLASELEALEQRAGGRLGVYAFDAATVRSAGWRANERFALCSTFKLALAAAVLEDADREVLPLDTWITYAQDDLVPHAPVTEKNLAMGGMTAGDLARATQVTSDNVAANLLIRRLGGPEAVTRRLRAWGDPTTRLDRYEPDMNDVHGDDPRDTTTPEAIANTVARLFGGELLAKESRETLKRWTIETQTGARRLRAGLPAEWSVGDKTGTAYADDRPTRVNDIAIVFRPDRAPLVVAAYYEGRTGGGVRPEDEAVLAEVGRSVAAWASA